MIGAVLVAGVATVAVGCASAINRMSALSEAADVVYAEGTVPVDALRKLQVDWWELQTHIARANIEALPPESRASSQEKGGPRRADPRRGRRGGRRPAALARRRGRVRRVRRRHRRSTSRWWPSSSRSSPTPRRRVRRRPLSWPPAPR